MPTVLTLERLKKTQLAAAPMGQRLVANIVLAWDYKLPRPTLITLEGTHNLPKGRGVFFAMNHTDRFNYWPFQYELHRQRLGYTATWVKPKYYENPAVGWFMERMNNIPLPSRGYLISTEFRATHGRSPNADEYRDLRNRANAGELPGFEARWSEMMAEVIRLNRHAMEELGLHVLVFPQGRRSVQLTRGHTGMMQMARYLDAPIVPVGCSGSNHCYPGNSPFSKGGAVTYRMGAPMEPGGPEGVMPFSREAASHEAAYQSATDGVMEAINGLVDPPYQWGAAVDDSGVDRFI